MLERTIEVQGLSFTQVDIFGRYLPARTSVESVLDKITDRRNKQKVCKRSNELAILFGRRFDIPDSICDDYVCTVTFKAGKTIEARQYNLDKESTIILIRQCALTNLNPRGIVQSMFTKAWFEGMVGSSDHDIQKLRKMVGNTLGCFHKRSKPIEKYENLKLKPLTSREKEYPEYVTARTLFESFHAQICLIADYDERMLFLLYRDHQIMYEAFQLSENIKGRTCITVCTNCRIHFESKKMPVVRICNSCKNKSAEQKKESRRIDRKGWVCVGIGECGGGCGSPKIKINTSGSCLTCYLSNL